MLSSECKINGIFTNIMTEFLKHLSALNEGHIKQKVVAHIKVNYAI
jgi:hypothetical protein